MRKEPGLPKKNSRPDRGWVGDNSTNHPTQETQKSWERYRKLLDHRSGIRPKKLTTRWVSESPLRTPDPDSVSRVVKGTDVSSQVLTRTPGLSESLYVTLRRPSSLEFHPTGRLNLDSVTFDLDEPNVTLYSKRTVTSEPTHSSRLYAPV